MGEITLLLERARGGDSAAWQRVVALLYDDLLRLAQRARIAGRASTLNATALVHECYLRIAKQGADAIGDRSHFLALAGRAMRQILVNHARDRMTHKRGGGHACTTLGSFEIAADEEAGRLLELDAALERLALDDPPLVQVIDCRIFGGMTEAETATALGLSLRRVQRMWFDARERLRAALS